MRGLKLLVVSMAPRPSVRRTPRGVRGLKLSNGQVTALSDARRTPRGVRGLKSDENGYGARGWESHPSRGAWIEIFRAGV